MKFSTSLFAVFFAQRISQVASDDLFNYVSTSGTDFGPEDWKKVSCTQGEGECPGWPNFYEHSIGWDLTKNECRSCPEGEDHRCGQHRQSPIELKRDRAIPGHENEKTCPDWHWISYVDGTCDWEDMQDSFTIERHALQIHTPTRSNGDIDCANPSGERKYPKMDVSKGFPDWFLLSRTDIKVPSEHMQEGKTYAAEVNLGHFYEKNHYKNKLGTISIFMQDYENQPPWPYLDKLICKFRAVEEKQRAECGLPPAPVYKYCELYRGQVRTREDLYEDENGDSGEYDVPTRAPLNPPNAIPIVDYGGNPDESQFPLSLCEGDCDFNADCEPGLMCHRRDALEGIPGCIGGEGYDENSDFCIFDPYADVIWSRPTAAPSNPPTVTSQPSLSPLRPKQLVDYGGSPPAEKFPLQYCEGDCDNDGHCAEGLMCFQRNEFEAVPGCIGGDVDETKSDYCILDPLGKGYTIMPTSHPTLSPTETASASPTAVPSVPPSASPVEVVATTSPTHQPSNQPTSKPTDVPTGEPTGSPTGPPTHQPTSLPSSPPSSVPSGAPTLAPVLLLPSSQPSYFPRPDGPMKSVTAVGWQPPSPLGECEGDCDDDDDCEGYLVCVQRNFLYAPVPGCLGGDEDRTLMDYCAYLPIPTQSPTEEPTPLASMNPTAEPTLAHSENPTGEPTNNPSPTPTGMPTRQPTSSPSSTPSSLPSASPTMHPTVVGSGHPTSEPTSKPTVSPSNRPTGTPTTKPTIAPTIKPTVSPSAGPTNAPSATPTAQPSSKPTAQPTDTPSERLTKAPTSQPTATSSSALELIQLEIIGWNPAQKLDVCQGDCDTNDDCLPGRICFQRNAAKVAVPGCIGGEDDDSLMDYCILDPDHVDETVTSPPIQIVSTEQPSAAPKATPSKIPTSRPTSSPSQLPSPSPTSGPSWVPSSSPTSRPTAVPTDGPSEAPTDGPTDQLTNVPTHEPTNKPTHASSERPSSVPSTMPSPQPSSAPTSDPTVNPTEHPTKLPTGNPTVTPTSSPTLSPSVQPTLGDPPLVDRGWNPPLPLGLCEGDCDVNADCGEGLRCFQRNGMFVAVPGCTGGDTDNTLRDYCVIDEDFDSGDHETTVPSPIQASTERPTSNPTSKPSPEPSFESTVGPIHSQSTSPTNSPTTKPSTAPSMSPTTLPAEQPVATASPTASATASSSGQSLELLPVKSQGWTPDDSKMPLQRCEGDCDTDFDCAPGLKCFQRRIPNTAVPGCLDGQEDNTMMDYCYLDAADHDRRALHEQYKSGRAMEDHMMSQLPENGPRHLTKDEARQLYKDEDRPLGPNDTVVEVEGQRRIVRAENAQSKDFDDEAYFEEIHDKFERNLQVVNDENYEQVQWWPYEWMVKVGTEYYFRYEGTQTVPPCFDTNHWRVMKDPIRVAPHQMRELERLIAWRRNDRCQSDTAGAPRQDRPEAVSVARPLQSYHLWHRKVFCECQDWPSKFPAEREWCRNYSERDPEIRLFQKPYNFQSGGF